MHVFMVQIYKKIKKDFVDPGIKAPKFKERASSESNAEDIEIEEIVEDEDQPEIDEDFDFFNDDETKIKKKAKDKSQNDKKSKSQKKITDSIKNYGYENGKFFMEMNIPLDSPKFLMVK